MGRNNDYIPNKFAYPLKFTEIMIIIITHYLCVQILNYNFCFVLFVADDSVCIEAMSNTSYLKNDYLTNVCSEEIPKPSLILQEDRLQLIFTES